MRVKDGNNYIYLDDESNISLYRDIESKNYKVIKVLKNDQRSFVALIEIEEKKYVYKEPREKNKRKWQRFLSIFRGSESKREYENIKKIKKLGFKSAIPYIAVEKRNGIICVDSYLLLSFIDGSDGKVENIDLISEELKKIHRAGYLHGDSHVANFMIKGKDVYLIDTKFLYNIYGKFGEVFEFIYLEESCCKQIPYDKSSFYYKGAMLLKRYLLWLGDFKKKLRGKK